MLHRSITCLLAIGAVSALLTLSPPTANAIPSAGDYEFTSGLTGTFTSDGTSLTAWSIQGPLTAVLWTESDPTLTVVNNSPSYLLQNKNGTAFTRLEINWLASSSLIGDIGLWSEGDDNLNYRSGGFTYGAVPTSVPEPSTGLLLLAGLMMLVSYGWQQRHPAKLQVG